MNKVALKNRFSQYLQIISNNIERLRGNMSQDELAKKAGVSRTTVRAAAEGKSINLQNLFKIADALGVSPADLFITDIERGEISYKHKLLMDLLKIE